MHLHFCTHPSPLQCRMSVPPSSATGLHWQLADEFWNLWAALGAGIPPQRLSWKALLPVQCQLPILAWGTGLLGTSSLRTWWLLGVSVEGMPCEHRCGAREHFCPIYERLSSFLLFSFFLLLLLTSLCSLPPYGPSWLKADAHPPPLGLVWEDVN